MENTQNVEPIFTSGETLIYAGSRTEIILCVGFLLALVAGTIWFMRRKKASQS